MGEERSTCWHHGLLDGWGGCTSVGEGVDGEDMWVSSFSVVDSLVDIVEVVVVDVEGEGVLVVVIEAIRDFNSLFSFLVSERIFSRVSMCILHSTFTEDKKDIFCTNS